MKRSFPSPPKRALAVREPPRFQALTPEMMISETDDDVMGDKVAQEVSTEQVTYDLDFRKIPGEKVFFDRFSVNRLNQ